MSTFDYKKFVEEKHAKFQTPQHIMEATIRRATNSQISSSEKLLKGEANEVYDIGLENDHHVILRISRETENPFIKEEWAMNQSSRVGVPVAQVLHIDEAEAENSKIFLCVLSKLPGIPLNETGKDEDPDYMKGILSQMGHYLSAIHSIKTQGFHHIVDAKGTGQYPTLPEYVHSVINEPEKYIEVGSKNDLNPGDIYGSIDAAVRYLPVFAAEPAYLAHGDVGTKHIMVDGEKITGILDFGNIRGSLAVHDFAWWDFWRRKPEQLEWMRKGYDDRTLFDDKYELKFNFIKLLLSLELLHWTASEGHMSGVERAKESIKAGVDYFKSI